MFQFLRFCTVILPFFTKMQKLINSYFHIFCSISKIIWVTEMYNTSFQTFWPIVLTISLSHNYRINHFLLIPQNDNSILYASPSTNKGKSNDSKSSYHVVKSITLVWWILSTGRRSIPKWWQAPIGRKICNFSLKCLSSSFVIWKRLV